MARSRLDLHEILKGLDGVADAYFQPDVNQKLKYPCIQYSRDNSFVAHADNVMYYFKKRYSVIVIDRDPDSLIPDLVEELPYTKADRKYISGGLNHFAFKMYF
jgi:hypothetical protein